MKEYKELLKLIKASQFSEVYIADKSVDRRGNNYNIKGVYVCYNGKTK